MKIGILILTITMLLFGCSQNTVSNAKYDQFTIKHSLTVDYTESDYAKSTELIDAI